MPSRKAQNVRLREERLAEQRAGVREDEYRDRGPVFVL